MYLARRRGLGTPEEDCAQTGGLWDPQANGCSWDDVIAMCRGGGGTWDAQAHRCIAGTVVTKEQCEGAHGAWIEETGYCAWGLGGLTKEGCQQAGGTWNESKNACEFSGKPDLPKPGSIPEHPSEPGQQTGASWWSSLSSEWKFGLIFGGAIAAVVAFKKLGK